MALSTPLASQDAGGGGSGGGGGRGGGGGFTGGLAFTVGGGWQIEGFDAGYMRRVHAGPIAAVALMGRIGSFIDEGAIVGGAKGFVFGATLSAHTPAYTLAYLGADTSSTRFGLDFTVETTGYVGSNSPLSVGSPWAGVSGLLGLKFGNLNGSQGGLLFGPSVFFGSVTQVRPFLGLRFEAPLAR
ncbi:MAG TPA: hypothetical protein VGV12_02430 [Gemmatimonadales bacterium]|nr:hypothetical protein [Gemmatimonadales bacterium]